MWIVLLLTPWVLLLLIAAAAFIRRPRLVDIPPMTSGPLVSIIVPARNEAGNIGHCLATLAASDYENREIIVVDDRSTDGTGDIVEAMLARSDGRIRLLKGSELPEGWYGKPWACWQGYREARGEVLLFTDADTRHECDLLGRTVAALEREEADMVTVLPEQMLGSFWERVIMPHMLFMLGLRYRAPQLNRTRNPRDVVANGQYILMPRASYEAIGGHDAVRGEVVEDLRLAQTVVEAGRKLYATHAEEFMQVRMYQSLAGLFEGWTKNVAIGAGHSVRPWLRSLVPWMIVAFQLVAWTLAPAILLVEAFAEVNDPLVTWAMGVAILSLSFWLLMHLRLRVPPLYSLIYPLGSLVVAGIVTRSAIRGKRVLWKGRHYS